MKTHAPGSPDAEDQQNLPDSLDDKVFPGWEPPKLPPMAPDGAPDTPQSPHRLPVVDLPTLCDQGPCVHLHVVTMPYDATKPMDGSRRREFRAVVRTCYPHPGIESPLNGTLIMSCNRWTPSDPIRNAGIERARVTFLKTPEGMRYQVQFEEWEAEQKRLEDESFADLDGIDADEPNATPTTTTENA